MPCVRPVFVREILYTRDPLRIMSNVHDRYAFVRAVVVYVVHGAFSVPCRV